MKPCSKCLLIKPESDFYPHRKRGKLTYSSRCKLCIRQTAKEWRRPNTPEAQEWQKLRKEQYRLKPNPEYRLIGGSLLPNKYLGWPPYPNKPDIN